MTSPHSSPNGVADSADDEEAKSDRTDRSDRAPADEADAVWAEIVARWSELREYAGYYIAANIDRFRLNYRAALMWAILGIVAGVIAVSVVAAAGVLLVVSLSTGVSQLLGGRVWLGQLVLSVAILIAATGGVWLVLHRRLRNYHRALVTKYERRKQQERTEYGTDVEQRAKERPQSS